VTNANALKVPEDYRRRQTLKNAERYITPELKTFEDKALSRRIARSHGKRFVRETARRSGTEPANTATPGAALAELDALATLAERAVALDYSLPRFTGEEKIEIEAGRHPVVEEQIDEFIANDTRLDNGRRLLLITGPNMGGKSTYMRQTALIVLLAHVGSFVRQSAPSSAGRPDLHPPSAHPTISPAAAPPSWWR